MRQIMHRFKYYLFFIGSFLPLSAFAQNSSGVSNFFTPPPGDLSVYLLGRVFGVVGNSLTGAGNQLIGILIGIFNAAWVVAIGIGILWVVWNSVVSAAGSGEMMGGGRGKKTTFMIIRIVIGFSLVVPSSTTGYSLSQTAVMWVAIQGVGLAGQVSDRFHKYIDEGGSVVATIPSNVEDDLIPVLPMNVSILQSEICMYKLQDITDQENKKRTETQNGLGEFTDVTNPGGSKTDASVGYSVNNDYTISFGTKNKDYNPSREDSHMYNSECGQIQFDKNMIALLNANKDTSLSEFLAGIDPSDPNYKVLKQFFMRVSESDTLKDTDSIGSEVVRKSAQDILTYQQLATTEAILNLQAPARAIASLNSSLDLTNPNDRNSDLDDLQKRSAHALASSTMNFATIFDPVRRVYSETGKEESLQITKDLKEKGWLYTPLAILHYGYSSFSSSVSQYVPTVIGPKLESINVSSDDKKSLESAVNLPLVDRYTTWAISYLHALNKYAELNQAQFGSDEEWKFKDKGYLDFLNQDIPLGPVADGINGACDWVEGTWNGVKDTVDSIKFW